MKGLVWIVCIMYLQLDLQIIFFNEIWRCYNKHKLFPTTLKDYALRWFMGLADNAITTWDDMKNIFLKNYHDYCKDRN